MIEWARKSRAFIIRDFRIESGYKASFFMRFVESFMLLVVIHFLCELIAHRGSPVLGEYGDRYFSFAIIGLAFARYFDLALKLFSESIATAQMTGCLEAMLSSQTNCVAVVLMSSLYGLISGAIQLLILLLTGALVFGVDFRRMNIPATLLVFILSVAIFVAFGVLSAAAVVWLKKGDPVAWIFGDRPRSSAGRST